MVGWTDGYQSKRKIPNDSHGSEETRNEERRKDGGGGDVDNTQLTDNTITRLETEEVRLLLTRMKNASTNPGKAKRRSRAVELSDFTYSRTDDPTSTCNGEFESHIGSKSINIPSQLWTETRGDDEKEESGVGVGLAPKKLTLTRVNEMERMDNVDRISLSSKPRHLTLNTRSWEDDTLTLESTELPSFGDIDESRFGKE